MHDYIMVKDIELWDVVLDGRYIPTKNVKERDLTQEVPKCRREYDETYRKKEKSVALKVSQNDASEDEEEMSYFTKRFQKIVKKHGGFQEEGSCSETYRRFQEGEEDPCTSYPHKEEGLYI